MTTNAGRKDNSMTETTITQVREELSDELDRTLLDVVRNGVYLTDASGNAILDADGKAIKRTAPAATLSVARQRLKDLGINKIPVAGDDADSLRKELGVEDDPSHLEMPKLPSDEIKLASA